MQLTSFQGVDLNNLKHALKLQSNSEIDTHISMSVPAYVSTATDVGVGVTLHNTFDPGTGTVPVPTTVIDTHNSTAPTPT